MTENPITQPYWTLGWRKPTANRILRASNWSGTWAQAHYLAGNLAQANPDLRVYLVASPEAERAGYVSPEDTGTYLAESGKRIRYSDRGIISGAILALVLPADQAEASYAQACHLSTGPRGVPLVGCPSHGDHPANERCPGCAYRDAADMAPMPSTPITPRMVRFRGVALAEDAQRNLAIVVEAAGRGRAARITSASLDSLRAAGLILVTPTGVPRITLLGWDVVRHISVLRVGTR